MIDSNTYLEVLSKDAWDVLTLKQRVERMHLLFDNATPDQIQAYAKAIHAEGFHNGLIGLMAAEVNFYDPDYVKKISEWIR